MLTTFQLLGNINSCDLKSTFVRQRFHLLTKIADSTYTYSYGSLYRWQYAYNIVAINTGNN